MKKFWMALVCGMCWVTGGTAANLYQVADVPIAAEVGTAMEAREVAIANGQVDAFWQLLRKMVQSDDLTKIPLVGQEDVMAFVQNVSLADEKTTATKYMAMMTVTFKPRAIQDFLVENQVPFLVQAPPTALIVPVYRQGVDVRLVEADSPVYAALKNVVSENGLFEWVLPEANAETAAIIREAWESPDADAWREILSETGVGRIFLWEVIQAGPTVAVMTRALPADQDGWDRVAFQTMVPNGRIETAVPALFARTESALEKAWRAAKTNNLETPNMFWITVPITSVAEWEHIRKKLSGAGFLEGLEVRGFRPRQALAALRFKGTGEQLDDKLRRIGLQVRPISGSSAWELTVVDGTAGEEGEVK